MVIVRCSAVGEGAYSHLLSPSAVKVVPWPSSCSWTVSWLPAVVLPVPQAIFALKGASVIAWGAGAVTVNVATAFLPGVFPFPLFFKELGAGVCVFMNRVKG